MTKKTFFKDSLTPSLPTYSLSCFFLIFIYFYLKVKGKRIEKAHNKR